MPYYTTRRDDSELRVVICPKCRKPDVIKYDSYISYTWSGYLLKLMKCNNEECGVYFTFYREDGLKEIDQKTAENGVASGRVDMANNGKDNHGHSFYVAFKTKPAELLPENVEKLLYSDGNPETIFNETEDGKKFRKWIKSLPSLNTMVRNYDLISNIDINAVQYFD